MSDQQTGNQAPIRAKDPQPTVPIPPDIDQYGPEGAYLTGAQVAADLVVNALGTLRPELDAADTGDRWPVKAEPFEVDVRSGHLQRVEPAWRLVADEDDEQPAFGRS